MKTKQSKTKRGIVIKPIAGLNYGHTVDVIAEDGDHWVLIPHGSLQKHTFLKEYIKVENYQ